MRFSSLHNISATQRHLSSFRYYDLLVHVFVVILLISNIVAPKICAFGPLRLSGAQLLFPITYIFGDIFTEVYGYAGSRRAIWMGFFSSALLATMSVIVVRLPAAPEWPNQVALATVLDQVPRVLAASLIAFWGGEFVNSYVLAKMKLLTKGRWLWTRTVGSTVAGQAVDTILVIIVIFYGKVSWLTIARLIVSGYTFKVVYEVLATPLTYWVVNSLKRAEGVDVYDSDTNFNPFGKEQVKDSQAATA
ncbi:MAG TPA: queuosine precursor transporter [Candidatus Angelobacter sp.]|nr:queuosine precursor transporter [Candidatus Angelobacter sp.]